MFKKTITFEDFDGNKQSRDFYFHLSKVELMTMADKGDEMQARIKRIIDAKDGGAILKELRDLIKLSVGVRSEDGQRFVKDEAAQSTLLDSPAYDELVMELGTDAGACVDFVRQLIPEKMQKELQKQLESQKGIVTVPDPFGEPEDNRPAYQKEHRLPRQDEVKKMTKEQIADVWKWREENGFNGDPTK